MKLNTRFIDKLKKNKLKTITHISIVDDLTNSPPKVEKDWETIHDTLNDILLSNQHIHSLSYDFDISPINSHIVHQITIFLQKHQQITKISWKEYFSYQQTLGRLLNFLSTQNHINLFSFNCAYLVKMEFYELNLIEKIKNIVAQNQHLETFILSGCEMTDSEIASILIQVAQHSTISQLEIKNIEVHSRIFQLYRNETEHAFFHNKHLRQLILGDHDFSRNLARLFAPKIAKKIEDNMTIYSTQKAILEALPQLKIDKISSFYALAAWKQPEHRLLLLNLTQLIANHFAFYVRSIFYRMYYKLDLPNILALPIQQAVLKELLTPLNAPFAESEQAMTNICMRAIESEKIKEIILRQNITCKSNFVLRIFNKVKSKTANYFTRTDKRETEYKLIEQNIE